ncbi:AlpA family transcriptional regulator [Flavobacterium cauense R2A-7]|uniref:AlpA family transcriptional regulator n=1 Tax=Flavobacterium cauense R2A-7 TaxID=1341154 RepID=A0A562LXR1_9FLAO|nr:helix-turn-helix domain-containing protein [Flavobacterium cauense]KGO83738.1 excisionase [Flavobacterium cauense R2A-7]TWI12352.1 AlpA family transcriptional regulator [Flavobacterium cauense R2A-7]
MDIIQKLLEIEALLKRQHAFNKEILTLDEAANYLCLSKSALYKITSRKEIPFYNPGGKKIYFRRIDLENWVLESKSMSIDEIGEEIDSYLSRTQKSKL